MPEPITRVLPVLPVLEIIGRCTLASLFLLGGIAKIAVPETYHAMMNEAGPVPSGPILTGVIVLELAGGLAIAAGWRSGGWLALVLVVHTLLINVLLHRFWELDGRIGQLELSAFFKNVAIAGGLLHYAATRLARPPTGCPAAPAAPR